jgi:hypothetical protein
VTFTNYIPVYKPLSKMALPRKICSRSTTRILNQKFLAHPQSRRLGTISNLKLRPQKLNHNAQASARSMTAISTCSILTSNPAVLNSTVSLSSSSTSRVPPAVSCQRNLSTTRHLISSANVERKAEADYNVEGNAEAEPNAEENAEANHNVEATSTSKPKQIRIAVLEGDGIGPEVTREAVKVLNVLKDCYSGDSAFPSGDSSACYSAEPPSFFRNVELVFVEIGDSAVETHASFLPEATKKLCPGADAVILGGNTSPINFLTTE